MKAKSHHYSVNGLNQYTSVAGAAYTYGANANLTSDGATNFVYEVRELMKSGKVDDAEKGAAEQALSRGSKMLDRVEIF